MLYHLKNGKQTVVKYGRIALRIQVDQAFYQVCTYDDRYAEIDLMILKLGKIH